ncbi:MAG: hypothetical protein D3917_01770 [Candidatus Electrothrix sp. AX5]|nr:hypothetical protein [Candidatus Electrothrix sp. AX5]
MLTPMKNSILLCVIFLSCIFSSTLAAGQDKAGWLNDRVTIRFQEEPMSVVLGGIAQQTGIAILYDEKLAGQKVTGYYKDVKFSEAINRLFSEKNKSIQVFKNEKKIIVKTFGAKQFILASSGETTSAKSSNDSEILMTAAELKKMHRQQYKEYKERIANVNEVLEGGMTRGEVKVLQKKQYEEYKKRIADDNEVLEGIVTRGEVKALHKKQYEEYKKRIADDNEVLEGAVTRGEVKALHKKQYEEYKKRIANENEMLEGGMTRGEIKTMQARQYKNYKNSGK